jgi:hypothetical protein
VQAQQGLQRRLDVAMPGVPGQVVEAVRLADRRQAPADRRGGVAFGQAGQVGADRRRRGRLSIFLARFSARTRISIG